MSKPKTKETPEPKAKRTRDTTNHPINRFGLVLHKSIAAMPDIDEFVTQWAAEREYILSDRVTRAGVHVYLITTPEASAPAKKTVPREVQSAMRKQAALALQNGFSPEDIEKALGNLTVQTASV